MNRFLAHSLAAVALLALVPIGAGAGEPAFQGKTVVVTATDGALVVWDATPELIEIVHAKLSDQAANAKLERDGLSALATELTSLAKSNPTVTLRIIYQKTGDVNPAYRAATFSGVERYANISMSGKDAFANRDRWTKLRRDKPLPRWIRYTVTGALPPR